MNRSVEMLRETLMGSRNVVCLLGRAPAAEKGCDFYRDDFIYDVEEKYGRSPDEICSTPFFNNRPKDFYRFYREELLRHRGSPDQINFALKRMQDDGRLRGVVTRGLFGLSQRAGCRNVMHIYGNIDMNRCSHCKKQFDADYILRSDELPLCDVCGSLIRPGISLRGELLDTTVMTQANDLIASADVLLVLGCTLQSRLGSLSKYYTGGKLWLVNSQEHFSDEAADHVCIGNIGEIISQAYLE